MRYVVKSGIHHFQNIGLVKTGDFFESKCDSLDLRDGGRSFAKAPIETKAKGQEVPKAALESEVAPKPEVAPEPGAPDSNDAGTSGNGKPPRGRPRKNP